MYSAELKLKRTQNKAAENVGKAIGLLFFRMLPFACISYFATNGLKQTEVVSNNYYFIKGLDVFMFFTYFLNLIGALLLIYTVFALVVTLKMRKK